MPPSRGLDTNDAILPCMIVSPSLEEDHDQKAKDDQGGTNHFAHIQPFVKEKTSEGEYGNVVEGRKRHPKSKGKTPCGNHAQGWAKKEEEAS